jgi:hypothetical protein
LHRVNFLGKEGIFLSPNSHLIRGGYLLLSAVAQAGADGVFSQRCPQDRGLSIGKCRKKKKPSESQKSFGRLCILSEVFFFENLRIKFGKFLSSFLRSKPSESQKRLRKVITSSVIARFLSLASSEAISQTQTASSVTSSRKLSRHRDENLKPHLNPLLMRRGLDGMQTRQLANLLH